MNRPAVFFDRDNTLIACDAYLGDPEQVTLIEGAAEAVARVRSLGFAAVVFSNQSGVARGMFTEEAVHAVNSRLDELLSEEDPAAVIDRHEFSPHHPEATVEKYRVDSDLRKPKPGMIFQAAKALSLDVRRSWVVGDAPRDVEAGKAAGCRAILLKMPSLKASPAAHAPQTVQPDFVAGSLKEAVDIITAEATRDAAREAAQHTEDNVAEGEATTEQRKAGDPEATSRPGEAQYIAGDPPAATPPKAPDRLAALAAKPKPWLQRAAEVRSGTGVSVRIDGATTPPPDPTPPQTTPAAEGDIQAAPSVEREARTAGPVLPRPVQPIEPSIPMGAPTTTPVTGDLSKLEEVCQQILEELRNRDEPNVGDFSVSKLLAGIVQVLSLAALFYAYLKYSRNEPIVETMLLSIALQTLTISLLIMGRQK